MKKRILSWLISCLMIASAITVSAPFAKIYASDNAGITFTASEYYNAANVLSTAPQTFEAVFTLAQSETANRNAVVGNYKDGSTPGVVLEIWTGGIPRLFWQTNSADAMDIKFDKVNACTGEEVRLTVTRDFANKTASCYINGELKQTVNYSSYANAATVETHTSAIGIGRDNRAAVNLVFRGTMKSVALYSDVRTEEEIVNPASANDADILCCYDFTAGGSERLKDLSPNANDLVYIGASTDDDTPSVTPEGMSFVQNTLYTSKAPLSAVPLTVEAYVNVPASVASKRIGVIYGNYQASGVACVSFEVLQNGVPRFYWQNGNGTSSGNCSFSGINIADGKWKHVAVVRDPAEGKAYCYINGVLAGTETISASTVETSYTNPICIGGDLRRAEQNDNNCRFLGKINSITAYSDVRSAAEIASDYKADKPDYNDGSLIAHYDLTSITEKDNRDTIVDLSNNGNDVYSPWMNKYDADDYSYTFAVVGDTQKIIQNDLKNGTQDIAKLYDYIVNNIEKQNIKLVLGLGDITETYSGAANEWTLAKDNIFKLNGKIPYILNRGNHDAASALNSYFNNTAYSEQLEGTYNGSVENSYFTLTVGRIKYLVMALDYGASDSVLNWAAGIVDSYKDHNVIITTHAYMYRDGTTLDDGDVCPPSKEGGNDGDDIWEKFVKNHENIVLVLSGHDPWDKIVMREDNGVNGNKVVQMLIDPQGIDNVGTVGMVAMFHFSEDGKTVQVEYYSTVEEKWYHPDNRFTFNLNVLAPERGDSDFKENEDNTGIIITVCAAAAAVVLLGICLVLKRRKSNHK